tara:strand:+ start:223 stop:465 length:243 start_codon:yes stop_codon:yes gene_type:complete
MNKITRNILVIGGIAFLSSFTTVKVNQIFELNEIKNTAEDMIGWVIEDVANNRLDTVTADTYINNLEEIVNRVQKINNNE